MSIKSESWIYNSYRGESGGIAAATHLARRDSWVTVVEKNAASGGRCGCFERLGHRFDTRPTRFIVPRVDEAEFSQLALLVPDMLNLVRVNLSYHLVFDDGSGLADIARFKGVPDAFESEDYCLRPGYPERHSFSAMLRTGWSMLPLVLYFTFLKTGV